MNPDDFTKYQVTCDTNISGDISVSEDYSVDVDISKYTITITENDTFDWLNDGKYDNSYSIIPSPDNPTIYTSFEQREKHDKYPALKKAWEDYLNMYNLTMGDPPIVD